MTLPEWKDRRVERENTYKVLNNKDGTITLMPVTGEIYEPGTPLNALNLNKINSQLSDKASVFSNMYSGALHEINNSTIELNDLFYKFKNKGKIRIAVVGDSITEGADNFKDNVYIYKIMNKLQKDNPNKIDWFNFALAGRAMWQFNKDDYIAVESETNIVQHFSRPWATIMDKSWKQYVIDYYPDLVIFAFGMNGANSTNPQLSGKDNYEWTKQAIDNMKQAIPNVSFTIVSNILPTDDKSVYNQDTVGTEQIARMNNEFAMNNNYPIINAYRLWKILKYGIDEGTFITDLYTDVESIINKKHYNIDLNISFKTNSYTKLDFRNERGNSISLELMDNGNILVKSNGTLILQSSNNGINNLKIQGSKIFLNNLEYIDYSCLQEGVISIYNKENISNVDCMISNFQKGSATYTELELLNYPHSGIENGGGNGINHPTPLGHAITYYNSGGMFINSINQVLNRKFELFNSKNFKGSLAEFVSSAYNKKIFYGTFNFPIKKEFKYIVKNFTDGVQLTQRKDINYSQINTLRSNEFAIFYGLNDTDMSVGNIFIGGFTSWDEANSKYIECEIYN